MFIFAIGDSHGNLPFIERALATAADVARRTDERVVAVSVGDFGFWPGRDGELFLDAVIRLIVEADVPLWVIDGNHDYPGDSTNDRSGYLCWSNPNPDPSDVGLHHIRRGTVSVLDGVTVGFFGGAVSPDRATRSPGYSRWPAEAIADAEVGRVESGDQSVDLMICHDSPWIPPNFQSTLRIAPGLMAEMAESRERLGEVYRVWQPRLLVHGHFHYRYRSHVPRPAGGETTIVGLECEDLSNGTFLVDLTAV
jgi:hypothetical protein